MQLLVDSGLTDNDVSIAPREIGTALQRSIKAGAGSVIGGGFQNGMAIHLEVAEAAQHTVLA